MKLHTLLIATTTAFLPAAFAEEINRHDGKPADMAKPVQVWAARWWNC